MGALCRPVHAWALDASFDKFLTTVPSRWIRAGVLRNIKTSTFHPSVWLCVAYNTRNSVSPLNPSIIPSCCTTHQSSRPLTQRATVVRPLPMSCRPTCSCKARVCPVHNCCTRCGCDCARQRREAPSTPPPRPSRRRCSPSPGSLSCHSESAESLNDDSSYASIMQDRDITHREWLKGVCTAVGCFSEQQSNVHRTTRPAAHADAEGSTRREYRRSLVILQGIIHGCIQKMFQSDCYSAAVQDTAQRLLRSDAPNQRSAASAHRKWKRMLHTVADMIVALPRNCESRSTALALGTAFGFTTLRAQCETSREQQQRLFDEGGVDEAPPTFLFTKARYARARRELAALRQCITRRRYSAQGLVNAIDFILDPDNITQLIKKLCPGASACVLQSDNAPTYAKSAARLLSLKHCVQASSVFYLQGGIFGAMYVKRYNPQSERHARYHIRTCWNVLVAIVWCWCSVSFEEHNSQLCLSIAICLVRTKMRKPDRHQVGRLFVPC